jgi:PhnB protein
MLYPYLNFNGNTKVAIDFYCQVFDLDDPQIMTYGNDPQIPEMMKDWIMHAQLMINGTRVMFSDAIPSDPVVEGNNVTLMLVHDDPAVLERWFNRLSDGADLWQPLQKTFFSELYGSLQDRFGIVWQFNCEPKS